MEENHTRRQLSIGQRGALAVLWPVSTVVMGFVAALISGEHGSLIFAMVGLYVGVAGASSYLLLPLVARYRNLGGPGRLATSAAAAALPTIAFLAYAWSGPPTQPGSVGAFFYLVAGPATVLACAGAMFVAKMESRWSA